MIENHVFEFPCHLMFWRAREEGLTRHRNPLFSKRTFITIENLCVDEMHTVHLGVFQSYVATALWALIKEDVWGLRAGLSEEAAHQRSALRLGRELFEWYTMETQRRPDKPLYELTDFAMETLGSKDSPKLGAKAAETGTLLEFAADLCKMCYVNLQAGAALTKAGEALVTYMQVTRSAAAQLRPAERQRLADAFIRFLKLREAAGIPYKPKMHLMLHLALQSNRFGNPKDVGTWFDDGA